MSPLLPRFLGVLAVVVPVLPARADPALRLGMTYGIAEPTLPEVHEIGPTFGLGWRMGPVVVEADYAYLSFLDDNTGEHGVQRLGADVRVDLWRDTNHPCLLRWACTRATSVYAEAGIAERFGHWKLDAHTIAPIDGRQPEGHLGVGFEMDNSIAPRHGFQIGLRVVAAPRDPMDFLCRSETGCTAMMASTHYDRSVLVDISWLIGG